MENVESRQAGRRTLWVLSAYQFLSNNRSSLFTVYFVLFVVQKDGVSVAEGLLAFSVAYVVSSLISPIAGRISDKFRRRRLFLLVGEAASLPFFVLIPLVPGFLLVSAFFLIAETILAFGSTSLQAFVADISSASERGGSYGFLSAVGSAGSVFGILGAGAVAEFFGLDSVFYMVGFVMAGTILLVLFAVPETKIPASTARKPIREMKGVAVFSFATSIRTLGTGAITAFFGTYAYILGASAFEVSVVAMAGLLTTALLGAWLGRKVDKFGEIPSYIYGTLIVMVSIGVYLLAGTWFELIPARVIYAAGFGLLSPAMLSWVTKIAPPNRKAEYLGFFSLINSTLWSFGPIPGGIVESVYGPRGLFVFAGAATMASIVAVYLLYARHPRQTKSTELNVA